MLLLVVQPVQVNIRFSLVALVKAVGNGCSDRHGNAMQPARNPGAHVGVHFFSSGLAFFSLDSYARDISRKLARAQF